MKTSIWTILILGLAAGFLLYTPMPVDLVDPWYYRFLVAGTKVAVAVASVRHYLQPGGEAYYQTINFIAELPLPNPDYSTGEDSIAKASYTEFGGVRVLVYEPVRKQQGLVPALVYYHGGGFAIGSTKTHGPKTRSLAEKLNMVVVSVEYRLAPVNPFPAAFEDCLAATKWLLHHASDYGVDAGRVAVGGDSAGGHLAVTIAQHVLDDESTPNIKLQVLFYPWLQMFDLDTPSYRSYVAAFGDTGLVAKPRIAEFLSSYILGRLDHNFILQVLENAHTSAEFKQSQAYRKILNYDIVVEEVGQTQMVASTKKGFGGDGNSTLWAEIKERLLDPRLAPLFRQKFDNLPTAFIATSDKDSIRDDGIFYARLLREAGVSVTLNNYLGAYHSITAAGPVTGIPTGVKIVDDAVKFIRDNI